MRSNCAEYKLIKRSIEQFRLDIKELENLNNNNVFSENEFLEIMMSLSVVKEDIGKLETICLSMIEKF